MHNDKKVPPIYKYQQEGVDYLKGQDSRAIFDEPGLGKTRQVVEAISADMDQGIIQGAIVVCPNFLKSDWEKEVVKYSSYPAVIFGNDLSSRKNAYLHLKPSIYIINYEAIFLEVDNLKRLLNFRPLAIVLDESQRIKNPDARTTRALIELRNLATKRIIMSGTPVANKPQDLWSQFFFLDGGESLGKSFSAYKKKYADNYHSLADLQKVLSQVGLRRRKADVLELPPKTISNCDIEMSGTQLEMYNTLRRELEIWVQGLNGETIVHEAENILTRMLRLAQIASNPRLIDSGYHGEPAKFIELDKIVENLMVNPEQKVLIWTSFVANVDELAIRYQKYGALPIHGNIKDDQRALHLELFHNNPNNRILVANPATAREGLTLTEANVAIYVDRTFSLLDYLQSQDRIHRISQNQECFIINLIGKDSIDEFIDYVLCVKQHNAAYIQQDITDPPIIGDITKAQLLQALL